MKERIEHKILFLSIILVSLLSTNIFADMMVSEFNGISAQKHLQTIYDQNRKSELMDASIKYEDIEDRIHMFNPEVLNLWNSWENNKSANDMYDEYREAADALSAGGSDNEMQNAMSEAQAAAMRIQADKNYSDSYINFLTNYQTEKNIVLSSKILFINYFKSNYALEIAKENYDETTRKCESVENNYAVGNATYNDVLTAKKNVLDANSSYVKAESDQRTYKRNLIINCGKSMNDDIEIEPDDTDYFVKAGEINLDADYEKALKNNFQYEIYKRKKENAVTTEVKNEAEIQINAAPEKIYNDLETKYSTIKDAMDTFNTKKIALDLATDTYNKIKNSYAHGSVSKKEMLSAESAVNVARLNLFSSVYDVSIAYENYEAAVEGLASC